MEALYTVYLKFKESDIPNTRIYAAIYRIPDLKSPWIPYTQKPWPTLIYVQSFLKFPTWARTDVQRALFNQSIYECHGLV